MQFCVQKLFVFYSTLIFRHFFFFYWFLRLNKIPLHFISFLQQSNGNIHINGYAKGGKNEISNYCASMESFEPIPMLTACLTYMGFYFLMLMGFLNQLLFKPKVPTENNRDVSHLMLINYCLSRFYHSFSEHIQ